MRINNKIRSYFGFAIKSRQIVFGADNVLCYRKKIYLVVISNDINVTSQKKIKTKCDNYGIPLIITEADELNQILNTQNCKCVAVINADLAKAIIKEGDLDD